MRGLPLNSRVPAPTHCRVVLSLRLFQESLIPLGAPLKHYRLDAFNPSLEDGQKHKARGGLLLRHARAYVDGGGADGTLKLFLLNFTY